MQPETTNKTKENLEASRENTKNISPVEQWDRVAFKLIGDTLAPKGYKQINSGKWRGLRIANADQPGIVKSKVSQCQKITAQMVRTYRVKAEKSIQEYIEWDSKEHNQCIAQIKACRFWQFTLRRLLQRKADMLFHRIAGFEIAKSQLNNVGIK